MCNVSTKTLSYVTEKKPCALLHSLSVTYVKDLVIGGGQSKKRRPVAEMPVILWTVAPGVVAHIFC